MYQSDNENLDALITELNNAFYTIRRKGSVLNFKGFYQVLHIYRGSHHGVIIFKYLIISFFILTNLMN